MSEKLERFLRAGGDPASVPDSEWEAAGGTAFRDKVSRFKAAGGDMATIAVPRAAPAAPQMRDPLIGGAPDVTPRGTPPADPSMPAWQQEALANLRPLTATSYRPPTPEADPATRVRPDVAQERYRKWTIENPGQAGTSETLARGFKHAAMGVAGPLQDIAQLPQAQEAWDRDARIKAMEDAAFEAEAAQRRQEILTPTAEAGPIQREFFSSSPQAQSPDVAGRPLQPGGIGPRPEGGVDFVTARLGRSAFGLLPPVAGLTGAFGALDENIAEAEELGIDPGRTRWVSKANELAMKPVEFVGDVTQDITGSETAKELAQLGVFMAGGRAINRVPGIAAGLGEAAIQSPVGQRLMPGVAASRVPLAERPLIPGEPNVRPVFDLGEARGAAEVAEASMNRLRPSAGEAPETVAGRLSAQDRAVMRRAQLARRAAEGEMRRSQSRVEAERAPPLETAARKNLSALEGELAGEGLAPPEAAVRGRALRTPEQIEKAAMGVREGLLTAPEAKRMGPHRARGEGGSSINPLSAVAEVGEAVRGGVERLDRGFAKYVTEPAAAALKGAVQNTPGLKQVYDLGERALVRREAQVSPKFAETTDAYEGRLRDRLESAASTRERLGEALSGMDDAARETVYRYMRSEVNDLPSAMNPKAKPVIDEAVREIQEVTRELVETKQLSPEAAAQYERYLPRLYTEKPARVFAGLGRSAPTLPRNFFAEDKFAVDLVRSRKGAVQALAEQHGGFAVTERGGHVRVKFETPEARQAFLDAARADPNITTAGRTLMEPLSAEARAQLGEVIEASDSAFVAIWRGKTRIARARLLEEINDSAGDAKGPWALEADPGGWVKFEGRKWGALKDQWVRPDVAKWLKGDFAPETQNGLLEFGKGWLAQWKANKTIWSPPTAARQWYGNTFFMTLGGVNPFNPANGKRLLRGGEMLKRGSERYKQMVTDGVMEGADFSAAELAVLEQFLRGGRKNTARAWGAMIANPALATEAGRAAQQKLGRYYSLSDRITRSTIYNSVLDAGGTRKAAIAEMEMATPHYKHVGPGVKTLSGLGAPFARFGFETMRITKNAAIHHPLRLAVALSQVYALQKILGLTFADGLTDEEREAIEREMGRTQLPAGFSGEGNPLTYDVRWTHPLGFSMQEPARIGEKDWPAWRQGAEILGIDESPALTAGVTLARGVDRYNRPISRATAGPGEYAADVGMELLKQQSPAVIEQALRTAYALVGLPWREGEDPESAARTLAANVLGIRLNEFDARERMQDMGGRMEWLHRELVGDIVDERKDKDPDGVEERREELKGVVGEFRERRAGLSRARKSAVERREAVGE